MSSQICGLRTTLRSNDKRSAKRLCVLHWFSAKMWTLGQLWWATFRKKRKSKCIQLQVGEVQEGLIQLRRTQLHLLYSGLGLEEPTDDIAPDIDCTRSLLGEFLAMTPVNRIDLTSLGFMAEVQEAMTLDSLDTIPMPSQRSLEGFKGISTQDLSLTQFNKELEGSPNRMVSPPVPLSRHELLCIMHSNNPCTPTPLHEGLGQGPWFSRTPTLTLSIGPHGSRTTISPPRRLNLEETTPLGSGCMKDTDHKQHEYMVVENNTAKNEVASEVVEHEVGTKDKSHVSPITPGTTLDDVIARTTHKTNGRDLL